MVGMSGKSSEPRRGQSTQSKKTAPGSGGGSNRAQPPPEALHVANILGDGVYPDDLSHKVGQVMTMLPSCQEEEVCIALHDHDFDPEKAISALLDSDPHSRGQGEWTTKKGRRSKGTDGGSDFIMAPGDSRLPGRQSGGGGRGTNRAASQSVRENYGGSVSVGGEGGKGRGSGEGGRGRSGKGRGGSGRGRSSSNRRDKEERDGKKEEKQRGERGERGGRSRNKAPRGARARARAAAAEPERAVEEKGGEDKPRPLPVALETWDDEIDPQPSTEWDDHRKTGSPAQPSPGEPPSPSSSSAVVADQAWDSEAESKGSQNLFPEAFTDPTTTGFPLPTASSAQPTVLTATTPASLPHQITPGSLPHQTIVGSLPQRPTPSSLSGRATAAPPVEFQTSSSVHSSRPQSRHRRLARSQIPTQPVEMPKGYFPEMADLGIAFGCLELIPPSTTSAASTTSSTREHASEGPSPSSSSSIPQNGLLATPTTNEARFQSDSVTTATLAYSTPFAEDSGIISIATTTTNSYGVKKLEAPPGLPHPLTNPHTSSVASISPSGSLPHSVVPSASLPHSVVPSSHSVVPSLPHTVVPSLPHTATLGGSVALTSTGGDSVVSTPLPSTTAVSKAGGPLLPPEPISLPPPPSSSLLAPMEHTSEHSKASFSTTTSNSQLLPQSFPTTSSGGNTGVATGVGGATELLPTPQTATPTSSAAATPTSKTLTAAQSSHHHGNQQQQQLQTGLQGGSKHSSLQQQQQAMIYPYMLQPPLVMPMSAYYDHDMSRYQAASGVSMAYYQHPTSSDPAMATGMGRDHVGSGFTEGAGGGGGSGKFGGRGAEISTSAAPPHSQQQGVQGSQLGHAAAMFNPYYGGNVIYPMYHGYGMPGFSHSIPKPSGGSSYPGGGVNSYQAPTGAGFSYEDVGAGQEFKMYGGMGGAGLGKPHPMSTSGAADITSGSGYKGHAGFDSSKSNYSTYSVPQGGYGFIPTGPMPLQMPPSYMPGHEGGGGAGGRGQKHSNKQYSGSHGNSQLWSSQAH